jgi:hypothetical protein
MAGFEVAVARVRAQLASFDGDAKSRGGVARLESERIVTKSMPWHWHPRQFGDATLRGLTGATSICFELSHS